MDNIVIYSQNWCEHLKTLESLAEFDRLHKACLTFNLAKCMLGKATVSYLGNIVGQIEGYC